MQLISLSSPEACIQKAKELLYKMVNPKTVLFLSGGSTPKILYEKLAQEEKIHPGAVAMVDERFGEKLHKKSNEKMIKETGLLKYFEDKGISWNPILNNSELKTKNKEETKVLEGSPQDSFQVDTEIDLDLHSYASSYDAKLREFFFHFPAAVAVLGIGADGHTAGIPVNRNVILEGAQVGSYQKQADAIASLQHDDIWNTRNLVTSYTDTSGVYGERITMTFTALSMVSYLIVLVFGKDKKQALEKMFTKGSLEEIPARFYNKPEISQKTIVITDQQV